MTIDPVEIVERAVLRCEAVIEQLAEIADTAEPAVAVKAISAQVRAAESELALLQNAGMLPSPLSRIGYEIDARKAASRAVEVLNKTRAGDKLSEAGRLRGPGSSRARVSAARATESSPPVRGTSS